ncbi:MAG: glutamine synthetase family protein [Cyclobacteriaceae bacterium]
MTKEEIKKTISESLHSKVRVAITDIDGILRGKFMHQDKFLQAMESGFGFCNVVFGWDANDQLYDQSKVTGWHTGYPDAEARLDLDTFRLIPWEDELPFVLGDFDTGAVGSLEVCPRSLFKRIIKQAESEGLFPVFSQEFEWFNFLEEPKSLDHNKFNASEPLTPGMFGYSILRASENSAYFDDLFELLTQFDVPVEGLHTETGPGVYEAALQYSDALTAADRAVLFKTSVKEIATRHGILATFMAKPHQAMPGCSGHVHQSLQDASGKNLFFDKESENRMSDVMKSYIAGQLHCLPIMLPMLAPTINSYKRLVEGAWAPTTLTWGVDNRTVALRALPLNAKSTRLETRVIGSDVNPYLAMAACLAAGLYGVKNKLRLDVLQTKGNGYENVSNGVLPRNLKEASDAMRASELARELFGEGFVDHFTMTRDWEWREFQKQVTDWEMKRYFEII